MRKQLKSNHLFERRLTRTLLAVSLSVSFAAAGCTTNRNPGSGDPTRDGLVRTTPTGSVNTGSEQAVPPVEMPPPMTSSYRSVEALPLSTPLASHRAVVAMTQPQRVRVLGPADPGLSGRGYYSDAVVTGQYRNPALVTNPQVTVNSTISSEPVPVITDGAGGETAGAVVIGGITADGGLVAVDGVTGAITANTGLSLGGNVNTAAPLFTTGATLAANAPTAVLSPALTPGAFAGNGGAATPTVTVSNLPPTTTIGAAPLANTRADRRLAERRTLMRPGLPAASAPVRLGTVTSTATAPAGAIRIVNDNGRILVTNQQ